MRAIFFTALMFVAAPPARVLVIPIHGEIDQTQAAFVRRVVEQALRDRPDLVLVDIDTPGGELDATFNIVTNLGRVQEAGLRMVTYIGPRNFADAAGGAWSAGVIIAMSSKAPLYMHPQSVIGAAAPITIGTEGVQMLPEKFISATRAKFAAVAQANGYEPNLAMAMVDQKLVVYDARVDGQRRFLQKHEIDALKGEGKTVEYAETPFDTDQQILTLDASRAVDVGMAKLASDRKAVYPQVGAADVSEEVAAWSWSENLVAIVTSGPAQIILLIVGLVGIWIELKSPGFGAPGVVGIASLALFLFGHYLAGLAQFTEIVLIIVGIILLAVEIFAFPGTFVSAALGLLCVTAGIVMAMQDFVIPDVAGAPWQVDTLVGAVLRMLGSFVGAAAGMALLAPLLPKIPIFNRVVLKTDLAAAGGFVAPGVSSELHLVNRQGVAVTDLRPGGKIEIDGALFDVIADGEFVEKGGIVVVQAIEGNRIRVERRRD